MKKQSAKMQDYIECLNDLFIEAKNSGKEFIEIEAKELHKRVSIKPTLPTCCLAMRQVMKEKDIFIIQPSTKTGFGTKLKVRYYLDEKREQRAFLYPLKQRGRKPGSVPKVNRNKLKQVKIERLIENWLNENRMEYHQNNLMIDVHGEFGNWKLILDISKQGKKHSFAELMFQVLTEIDDHTEKYTICIKENQSYRNAWNKIPKSFKEHYNVTLLVCGKNKIKEFQ